MPNTANSHLARSRMRHYKPTFSARQGKSTHTDTYVGQLCRPGRKINQFENLQIDFINWHGNANISALPEFKEFRHETKTVLNFRSVLVSFLESYEEVVQYHKISKIDCFLQSKIRSKGTDIHPHPHHMSLSATAATRPQPFSGRFSQLRDSITRAACAEWRHNV